VDENRAPVRSRPWTMHFMQGRGDSGGTISCYFAARRGNFRLGGSNKATVGGRVIPAYYPRELRSNVWLGWSDCPWSGPDGLEWVGFPDSGPSIGLQSFRTARGSSL